MAIKPLRVVIQRSFSISDLTSEPTNTVIL